ncbi:MAG: hypothetical protein ACUVUH_04960 [bacterium]
MVKKEDAFAVHWVLKNAKIIKADMISREINNALEKYPHGKTSEEQEQEVRRKIYATLTQSKIENPPEVVDKIIQILKKNRRGKPRILKKIGVLPKEIRIRKIFKIMEKFYWGQD